MLVWYTIPLPSHKIYLLFSKPVLKSTIQIYICIYQKRADPVCEAYVPGNYIEKISKSVQNGFEGNADFSGIYPKRLCFFQNHFWHFLIFIFISIQFENIFKCHASPRNFPFTVHYRENILLKCF